jgi:hypothetical protein
MRNEMNSRLWGGELAWCLCHFISPSRLSEKAENERVAGRDRKGSVLRRLGRQQYQEVGTFPKMSQSFHSRAGIV